MTFEAVPRGRHLPAHGQRCSVSHVQKEEKRQQLTRPLRTKRGFRTLNSLLQGVTGALPLSYLGMASPIGRAGVKLYKNGVPVWVRFRRLPHQLGRTTAPLLTPCFDF